MKFNKLVKTIDYVTYPSLQELRKINRNLGDSISKLTDIFFSAVITVAIDKTELIQLFVNNTCKNISIPFLQDIIKNHSPISIETFSTIIAIILGILICVSIRIGRWFHVRRKSKDKRKVSQREGIARDFYKLVIPQLITIKSLLEQHDESDKQDLQKRYLLLLQTKYEICDLILILDRIKILEIDKDGTLLKNSKDVLDLIGVDAYNTVLEELIRCVSVTIQYFSEYKEKASVLVNSIISTISSSNTICATREINQNFNSVYKDIIFSKETSPFSGAVEEPTHNT